MTEKTQVQERGSGSHSTPVRKQGKKDAGAQLAFSFLCVLIHQPRESIVNEVSHGHAQNLV